MINKFADKLDHLTPDQVYEVMELFADPSIKVKEILEAYNIDVSACYLGRILPPIKTDKVCELRTANVLSAKWSRKFHCFQTRF